MFSLGSLPIYWTQLLLTAYIAHQSYSYMKCTHGSSFLKRQFWSIGENKQNKTKSPICLLTGLQGGEANSMPHLGHLALTQGVVDAISLLSHGLIKALQILHQQCYHLPVHLQEAKGEKDPSHTSPQMFPFPQSQLSALNEQTQGRIGSLWGSLDPSPLQGTLRQGRGNSVEGHKGKLKLQSQ